MTISLVIAGEILTSATCHIVKEKLSVTTAIAVGHGACYRHLHFAENHVLFTLFCATASRILHPPPNGKAMRNQKLTPAALGGKQFEIGHAGSCVIRKVSVFCLCVILVCYVYNLCFYLYIYIYIYIYLYIYVYIIIYIRFYNNKYNNNAIIIIFITKYKNLLLTNQLININIYNLI